ncbi:MAG: outer membrane beta-barrel protein [Bdellovibrionaceae bacterium]|nr:outer membrane beta-barrel protein [Pseudobdellovibrionaceae bacterium]
MKHTAITKTSTIFSLILILAGSSARAENISQSNLGVELNGYLDFYYQLSPQGHPSSLVTTLGPAIVEGRYFDKHVNQMTLNMAEISLKKKIGKVSFRTDIAAGEMVDQLSGGGSQSAINPAAQEPTRNLTQATLTYAPTDQLAFTVGKFYTHMGLEVTKAKDNWQYSRTYLYNYGIPFWHEGLSGTYVVLPGKFSSTFYLLNAWDGRISQEQNKSTTVGANLNFTGFDGIVANYNYIGGHESTDHSFREAHEFNLTYILNPSVILAADYLLGTQKNITTLGDAKWTSFALYLKASFNNFYSISPRYEFFDDSDQGFALAGGLSAAGLKQKITSMTLTNNFNLGDGLEARVEIRWDKSDSDLYFKNKDGNSIDHQESYVASLLYVF